MRPAKHDWPVYAGEPAVLQATFTDGTNPLALTGTWGAQARRYPGAPDPVEIAVDDSQLASGVLVLTVPADAFPARDAQWEWDLQGSTWGTVLAGKMPVTGDVTRDELAEAGSITDLVATLGPDEVVITASAQLGPQGNPGDDGREVELGTSATHVQWRYVGDAEWTDLVALADLTGDDGTEIELGTSATHIQWRYVGGVWTDLVALADITGPAGDDGIGVPDPSAEPDDRWLRTESGALVYTDAPAADTDKLDMVANTRDIVGYERGFTRAGVTDAMVGTPLEGTAAVWERAAGSTGNWARNATPSLGTPGWWGSTTNGTQALVWDAGSTHARQSMVVTNLGSAAVHALAAYVDASNYAYCFLNRANLRIGYVLAGVDNIVRSVSLNNLSFQGARILPLSFWTWTDGSNLHLIARFPGNGLEDKAAVAGSINGTRFGVMQSFSGVKFRDYYLQVG